MTRYAHRGYSLAAGLLPVLVCVLAASSLAFAAASPAEKPVLRIAYLVPADRQPAANYPERLDRVMTEVQRFYRDGMAQNGYGPKTFALDRDAVGRLNVRVVHGSKPLSGYSRDWGLVNDEVRAQLAKDGIDVDREVVVVFGVMLDWRDGKAVEVGPYCGGGSVSSGMCNVYDDALLDPALLSSTKPGGYYGQPCSIGEFNSHYIGGIAHELGHALGLPHDCETKARRPEALSLMGSGNHTYGNELRGLKPGTFLSGVSAMLLARHPLFLGTRAGLSPESQCDLQDLTVSFAGGIMRLAGRLVAKPPVFGIAAYNDDMGIAADYDAVGWTCPVDQDGRFRLEVGEIAKPGRFQLRLLAVHESGSSSRFAFDYTVDGTGTPDIAAIQRETDLGELARLLVAGKSAEASAEAQRLSKTYPRDTFMRQAAPLVRRLTQPDAPRTPEDIPDAERRVCISDLQFRRAEVGWAQLSRDRCDPSDANMYFLRLGGTVYDRGLWAHAPSRVEIGTAGKWMTLKSGFGLRDGADGSVAFVVRGDGKELFRSPVIRDHQRHDLDIKIVGVQTLELVAEDGGDGNSSDWAIWIEPELIR